MGAFIVRQPNGLLCRFSTIVDCPTHINMTEEDYIRFRGQQAMVDAKIDIKARGFVRPFHELKESFSPGVMSKLEFCRALKKMEKPAGECTMEEL